MLCAPALVAILLYWPSLQFPLIYDTLLHIRIARSLNLATVWLPTRLFGFYRPLTFLPLLLIHDLWGYYPPWLLNGLNVAQHALNAALLAALSWRLWRRPIRALTSGLLLALFPFAYQAVAVYGHNVHPASAGLMLLGLHTYLKGIESHRIGWRSGVAGVWWFLTGLLFALGVLSHETAVLFGPLAALVHWNARWQGSGSGEANSASPRASRLRAAPWLVFSMLGVLYLLLYQALPIQRSPQGISDSNSLWPKVLYLGQAAGHPFAWFAHLLPDVSAAAVVVGGLVLTLGLTVWSARRPANRPALLLGWGWWALASVVIAIPLQTGYLLHGPRLLYLGGVGLALLWPVLLEPLRGRAPLQEQAATACDARGKTLARAAKVGWLVAISFILLTGWAFVRGQLALYAELTCPVRLLQRVKANRPPAEGVLLINLPAWLAPRRNTYPVGSEHVAMLGYYLSADELVAENLGGQRPVRAIKLPELLSDPGYPYTVFGQADLSQPIPADWAPAGSQLFLTTYTADGAWPLYLGQLSRSAVSGPSVARLGRYELLSTEVSRFGDTVELVSRWRWDAGAEPGATTSLLVQLLDGSGQLVAQADGPPLGVRSDLINLSPGWEILDRRALEPAAGVQPSRLLLGAYDYVSGERFPAFSSSGQRLADDVVVLPLSP